MDDKGRDKHQIAEAQSALVIQSNTLIRNVRTLRYGLSNQQQRILVYLISKIGKGDKNLKRVKFNMSEYCDICNLKKNGTEFDRIKEALKGLRDKSYWVEGEDGEQILFAWIDTLIIKKNKSVEVILSEALTPYLLNLSRSFTAYELVNALCLRRRYSLRLYELLKSYLWIGKWEVNIDQFREIMHLQERYPLYKELKRCVIDESLEEIDKYTDLEVSYTTKRKGRSIDTICFHISQKENVQLVLEVLFSQDERLGR